MLPASLLNDMDYVDDMGGCTAQLQAMLWIVSGSHQIEVWSVQENLACGLEFQEALVFLKNVWRNRLYRGRRNGSGKGETHRAHDLASHPEFTERRKLLVQIWVTCQNSNLTQPNLVHWKPLKHTETKKGWCFTLWTCPLLDFSTAISAGQNSPMAKSAWYPLLCPTILDGDRPSNDCLVVANCGGSPLVIVSCIRVRIFFGQQPLGKAFWNHSRTSRNRSCCTKIWSFGDKVQHTPVKWWWGSQCSFWHWSRDSRGISPPKKLGLNEPNKNSHGKGRQQPSKQYRKWSPLWHQNTSSQAGHSSFIYSGCGRVGKPDKFPSTLFNDPNLLHRYSWTTEFSSLGHVIIDLTCQEEAPRFQHLLAL